MKNNASRILNFDFQSPVNSSPSLRGSPERNLLMAILERAILDYVGNAEKDIQASEEWIFSMLDQDDFSPFSFNWVCSELDLDPKRIAKIIQAMPKRGHHKVAPWYFMKHEENKAA